MAGLPIGEVARRTGLNTSALRYYERAGLLPPPPRSSRQRRYDPEIVGRVRMIQAARAAGFTIEETREFLTGFAAKDPPSARWRALAERKRAEIDTLIARAEQMRTVLDSSFRCECEEVDDCARLMSRPGRCG
jgi:MerR family redox-sensitive transcriptional activator SoxR